MRTATIFYIALMTFAQKKVFSQGSGRNPTNTFKTEIFINENELNSGLYEGSVIGRRLFGTTQVPHGFGVINYFTNDKFHRLNYTGEWVNGTRSGNGTTYFKDGSVYEGEYKDGVEHGLGTIRYKNGNVLEGEFRDGKIHGHAVFRYPNGNQREGFFRENVLDGQVIFTESNGRTVIEVWRDGRRVDEEAQVVKEGQFQDDQAASNDAKTDSPKPDLSLLRAAIRQGDKSEQFFFPPSTRKTKLGRSEENRQPKERLKEGDADELSLAARLRLKSQKQDRSVLMAVFESVASD